MGCFNASIEFSTPCDVSLRWAINSFLIEMLSCKRARAIAFFKAVVPIARARITQAMCLNFCLWWTPFQALHC